LLFCIYGVSTSSWHYLVIEAKWNCYYLDINYILSDKGNEDWRNNISFQERKDQSSDTWLSYKHRACKRVHSDACSWSGFSFQVLFDMLPSIYIICWPMLVHASLVHSIGIRKLNMEDRNACT
jgi:hypothetical protein